jgi:hypothetical protein
MDTLRERGKTPFLNNKKERSESFKNLKFKNIETNQQINP